MTKTSEKTCPTCSGRGKIEVVNQHWLLNALTEVGWSQSDLARAIPCTRGHVSDMCHGRRAIGQHVIATLRKKGATG